MISAARLFLLATGMLALTLPDRATAADPLAELAAISAFKDVNLDKLAAGTVLINRGTPMSFPRGLSVESLYVVRKPVPATAALHVQWNPNKHPELKVFLHGEMTAKPTLADFQKLGSAPSNASVKAFVAATQKLGSGGTELQLTKAEAAAFAGQPGATSGTVPPKVVSFWSDVLLRRTQAFISGGMSSSTGL